MKRFVIAILMAWILFIGVDFLFHASVFSSLWEEDIAIFKSPESLSLLIPFFCLFKSDNLFSKYFALSPSLWIDKYSIYKFNHVQTGFSRKKYLYFASGSKETINKILKGTNEAKVFFDKKQYTNSIYNYDIWNGETYNSEVPLSLEKILKEKL